MEGLANPHSRECNSIFDDAARLSPEASVALYSLGSVKLLDEITRELVECLRGWGLLNSGDSVLDLGCGIARIAAAVAPMVSRVVAVDVSSEMVRLAHERTKNFDNVTVTLTEGNDLTFLENDSFDVVLAIDSFPYLVHSGRAAIHVQESSRVLKLGGRMLIMNYSYRGNLDEDRAELADVAQPCGLEILRNGTGADRKST